MELFKIYAFKDQFNIAIEEGRILFPDAKEELTYGEAIWRSIDKALLFINPKPNQVFYDLGCGTGRICFFTSIKYNLKSKGIELLPTFIHNAQKVKEKYNVSNVDFIKENWLTYDLSDADIIYIAATCLEEETLKKLINKLNNLKKGTYIISVSENLKSNRIQTIKKMKLPFSWGKSEVFISKIF